MTALGLDTSVVVRLLAVLPEGQALRARARLEQALDAGETVLVTDLVIAEAYHALHHHYRMPKAEAITNAGNSKIPWGRIPSRNRTRFIAPPWRRDRRRRHRIDRSPSCQVEAMKSVSALASPAGFSIWSA